MVNSEPALAPILMISAVASGQGKTTVTAALARYFRQAGKVVRVFKTGADFIDPMMLEQASGDVVESLDLWLNGEEECRRLLYRAAQNADLVLIEGVMGLYDGAPSSADLANAFEVPVLAVIDASAMAQTVGAVALGLRDFGPVKLAGVIANRIASDGHLKMVKSALRDIPLLASLPRQSCTLPERHLGLALPEEQINLEQTLDQLGHSLRLETEAWAQLLSANNAQNLAVQSGRTQAMDVLPETAKLLQGKTIAIARDAAFAFIYPANLACLKALGAQLEYFSPLRNEAVPEHADAVFLPGGYPELHAKTLQNAHVWQASIRRAHRQCLPIYAECGGMISLSEQLVDSQGKTWNMAGLLPGVIHMQKSLQALGMQSIQNAHGELRGHTFHFSRFDTDLTPNQFTLKHIVHEKTLAPVEGEAVYKLNGLHASYFHAYFPSNPSASAHLFLKME